MLAPRWRAASPARRRGVVAAVSVVVLAAVVLAIVYPRKPSIVYNGPTVSFNMHYPRGELHRVPPPAGAYARVERRDAEGRLLRWFEVDALRLPPFTGEISGALPVYATHYVDGLATRLAGFELQTETKTRINQVPGYTLTYSFREAGREYFGRAVMLLSALSGVRDGVTLTMATVPGTRDPGPDQVGGTDILEVPLRSFRLGS